MRLREWGYIYPTDIAIYSLVNTLQLGEAEPIRPPIAEERSLDVSQKSTIHRTRPCLSSDVLYLMCVPVAYP